MTDQIRLSENGGTLRSRIELWEKEHASEYPEEIRRLFADKIEEILKSGILSKSPRVGQAIPDFELKTVEGIPVRLGEKVQEGPVILNFYRGSWCPFCTLEFQALLEALPHFRSRGASVLAISPQVVETNIIPVEAGGGFINLSDRGNEVARRFGLVYPLGDEIRKVYSDFGIRLEYLNADDRYEVPVPASYVVDREMKIRYAFASADLTERAEPETLLREVAAIEV